MKENEIVSSYPHTDIDGWSWAAHCDRWNVLGAGLTDQQHSSGLGLALTLRAALRQTVARVANVPVPAFLTSGQWPAGGDLPGSRDRGRCLEQELQFCSCRWQACSYQSMRQGSEESFFLVFQCFRICSRHVLLAGPPRKCIFLLHCVPFHSFVIEPWIHLCHLCLSFIQLYKKRRI